MTPILAKVTAIEKRGDQYQVIVQISPKYRGGGVCDAFGCGFACTLTFGLGEALANGSVEGGSCHTTNCGLGFGSGLAFTGGAVGELEAFAGLGSALDISVAYRQRNSGDFYSSNLPVSCLPDRRRICASFRSKSLSVASKAVAVLFALVFINLRSPADIQLKTLRLSWSFARFFDRKLLSPQDRKVLGGIPKTLLK